MLDYVLWLASERLRDPMFAGTLLGLIAVGMVYVVLAAMAWLWGLVRSPLQRLEPYLWGGGALVFLAWCAHLF